MSIDSTFCTTSLFKCTCVWWYIQLKAIKQNKNWPLVSGNWLLERVKPLFINIVFNVNALIKCVWLNRFKVTYNESINEILLFRGFYHWTMQDPVSWWIQSKVFVDYHKALGILCILMKWAKPLSFNDLIPVVKTLKSNNHVNANQL